MALLLAEYDEEVVPQELTGLGSYNHSYLQAKLAAYFFSLSQYTAFTELSLDPAGIQDEFLRKRFKETIKPDIAVYERRSLDLTQDILRMEEMPLLAVEILSPMQGTQVLLDKVRAYFELGVKSCWIVYPPVPAVSVYSSPKTFQSFSNGDIEDNILGITLPILELFS